MPVSQNSQIFQLDAGTLTLTHVIPAQVANGTTEAQKFTIKQIVDLLPAPTVQTVKVSVSSAEILALGSVPKILVAAPGSGKMLVPLNSVIVYNYNSIAYGGSFTDLQLEVQAQYVFALISNLINQSFSRTSFNGAPDTSANFAVTGNRPIQLTTGGAGDPTLGNGTLSVYLTYTTIDL